MGADRNKRVTRWQEKLRLYVIIDPALSRGRSHGKVASSSLEGGATALQLRDKTASTRKLVEAGKKLREVTRRYGALFLVNDRLDVALAVDADGVHVGSEDMPPAECRRLLGEEKIIGVSADTVEEALAAEREGADYLGCGPVYSTSTKGNAGVPLGPEGLEEICRTVTLPVVGIGGIEACSAPAVLQAGAAGVAVISAVVSAESPRGACCDFLEKMG